ncbi:MAG: hypothetical protein M1827_007556 [Pycnora praestabilis]|nr:MAG: hypothetical protein M1827_007556 [Pycnora praestabilis]
MEYFDFTQASVSGNRDEILEGLHLTAQGMGVGNAHGGTSGLHYASGNSHLPLEPSAQTCPMGGSNTYSGYTMDPLSLTFYRPGIACDYCSERNLDCIVTSNEYTACTCCFALFQVCSFSKIANCDAPLAVALGGLSGFHGDYENRADKQNDDPSRPSSQEPASDSIHSGIGMQSCKDTSRFPKHAVMVLKGWIAEHIDHPYPTAEEKDALRTATGLKKSQISNWLANARRRGAVGKDPSFPPSQNIQSDLRAVDTPRRRGQPGRGPSAAFRNMDPMERWKHSPPEHEAASVLAIANAVATSPYTPERRTLSRTSSAGGSQQASSAGSSISVYKALSINSHQSVISSGSDLSWGSVYSHRSARSAGSVPHRRRRRVGTGNVKGALITRMFQCTFCTNTFKTKHDWQRHEKSLHLSLERWTCSPRGGLIRTPTGIYCAFCLAVNPSANHLDTSHNYHNCQEKTVSERTFYRKDHLRQHLRLMHNCRFDPSMESWQSMSMNVKSQCGFCEKTFPTWACRVEHLAVHFRYGAQMEDWKGDRGFEPDIEALIENALPINTIAKTRSSPFAIKAIEHTREVDRATCLLAGENEKWWHHCAQQVGPHLAAWMKEQLEFGAMPDDKTIQRQARTFYFGDSEDPWNQTCADHDEWLQDFKRTVMKDAAVAQSAQKNAPPRHRRLSNSK